MKPIGILDEHPAWSDRLIAELDRRRLPWERIDHARHGFDPGDREPRFSVVVNRTSPSSHTRGHRAVLFYTEPLLAHYESLGIPIVNPLAAYRFEKSKALQIDLFERLGVPYPRTRVVNHVDEIPGAARRLGPPVLVKPNVGGSGAGIVRFDALGELEAATAALDLGPDHTALVQEYVEPADGAVVRVEVLDGRVLYAIRIVRSDPGRFNLCPADLCEVPPGTPVAPVTACAAAPALAVTRAEPAPEAADAAIRLARAASIDVGGVEYLTGATDGRIRIYDVNATSNFVADAPAVLGFDPFPPLVDLILRRASEGGRALDGPAMLGSPWPWIPAPPTSAWTPRPSTARTRSRTARSGRSGS
jgi:hypothetical protein